MSLRPPSSDITVPGGGGQRQFPNEVTASYPPGGVPRTPLELRVGPHPKKDHLIWKTPPSRQLSQQKRQEFELDVTERFYDDYMGPRTTGDSRNEVMTGVHKLGFNPDLYRMNALQGMAYDPSRPVPKHVNFQQMLRNEQYREQERVRTQQMRQRRLSDSMISQRIGGGDLGLYGPPQRHEPSSYSLPKVAPMPLGPSHYQQSPMHKTLGDAGLSSEIVPEVEKWIANASQKDREVATKFIRTISSQGQRPADPATKASKHSSRVRSAVMTPSRQQRMDKDTNQYYKHLERSSKDLPRPMYSTKVPPLMSDEGGGVGSKRRLKRSNSDVSTTNSKGMFTATRQQPAHFTIHPEWASEGQH